jgi:hypothetical protein
VDAEVQGVGPRHPQGREELFGERGGSSALTVWSSPNERDVDA